MANRNKVLEAIKKVKEASKERKFTQSIDLIITLKEYDIKKEQKIEEFIRLPKGSGKENKICALVGAEMKTAAAKHFTKVIADNEFSKWKLRETKKLGREFDFFIAQADIMPQIAQTFGKAFGTIGKMPNPAGGQIVPKGANLAGISERFKDMVKVSISKIPVGYAKIGTEKMSDEDLADNAMAIIEQLEHKLPRGKHNMNKILIKTTMGGPVRVNE